MLYTHICDEDLRLVLKFVLRKKPAAILGITFSQFVTFAFKGVVHFVRLLGSQFMCRTIVLSKNRRLMGDETKFFAPGVRLGRLTMETWAEIGNIEKTGTPGMIRMCAGYSVLQDNDDV
jgi:hypothetical protein